MYVERMQLQRAVLLEVIGRDKAFDMSSWVGLLPVLNALTTDMMEDIDCGTASCAFGWLCRDPRGKALGLGLNKRGDPVYQGASEDGSAFFDLPISQARWLLMPGSYDPLDYSEITPQHVIERIDWLLEGKEPDDFPEYSVEG